jgi:DNA-binding response OmpR family regulator
MMDHTLRCGHILVVDDDENVRMGWVEVLATAGYSVAAAGSFEHGRLLLDVHRPNLLITDVRLGDFNGLQLALRARSAAQPLPTIVITGFADPVIKSEVQRLEAIYLEKPVRPDQLLAAVSGALRPVR